jgi:hypothetical protein
MTDHDHIADLADRMRAKQRRGEDLEFEFALEFGALTEDEREEFVALLNERTAHAKEVLEAIKENVADLAPALRLSAGSHHRAGVRRAGPRRRARPAGAR